MISYRIIYVSLKGDPCHWQLQKRKYFVFWVNACGNVSSATTAGHEMMRMMGLYDIKALKANKKVEK
jgi:hypothetical protein